MYNNSGWGETDTPSQVLSKVMIEKIDILTPFENEPFIDNSRLITPTRKIPNQ